MWQLIGIFLFYLTMEHSVHFSQLSDGLYMHHKHETGADSEIASGLCKNIGKVSEGRKAFCARIAALKWLENKHEASSCKVSRVERSKTIPWTNSSKDPRSEIVELFQKFLWALGGILAKERFVMFRQPNWSARQSGWMKLQTLSRFAQLQQDGVLNAAYCTHGRTTAKIDCTILNCGETTWARWTWGPTRIPFSWSISTTAFFIIQTHSPKICNSIGICQVLTVPRTNPTCKERQQKANWGLFVSSIVAWPGWDNLIYPMKSTFLQRLRTVKKSTQDPARMNDHQMNDHLENPNSRLKLASSKKNEKSHRSCCSGSRRQGLQLHAFDKVNVSDKSLDHPVPGWSASWNSLLEITIWNLPRFSKDIPWIIWYSRMATHSSGACGAKNNANQVDWCKVDPQGPRRCPGKPNDSLFHTETKWLHKANHQHIHSTLLVSHRLYPVVENFPNDKRPDEVKKLHS